jgi:hypothetical protein
MIERKIVKMRMSKRSWRVAYHVEIIALEGRKRCLIRDLMIY